MWQYILIVGGVVGFLLTVIVFYPGYRSPDSEWQMCQAMGNCELNNWHPVSMALVWRLLLTVTSGVVSSMLFFQAGMLWLGLCLIGLFFWRKTGNRLLSALVLCIGLLPNILNISGVIWKDVQMASALVLSIGILMTVYDRKKTVKYIGIVLSFILFAYAVSVRANAIIAVIPLLPLLLHVVNPTKRWVYTAISMGFATLMLVAVNPLINRLAHPVNSSASATMYAYDIVNILPADIIYREAPEGIRDKLAELSSCSLFNSERTKLEIWDCVDGNILYSRYDELKTFWKKAVFSNPKAYIAQKIETYAQFVFSDDSQGIWFSGGASIGDRSRSPVSLASRSVLYGYVHDFGYKYFPFIYKPWFWIIVSILIMAFARRAREYKIWIYCLASSSLLYILSYSVGSLTPDYRYIYWSVMASILAGALLAMNWHYKKDYKHA